MKTKTHIQRLVKLAFDETASVTHKRYDPFGIRREGYWLIFNHTMRYIGYSKQTAVDYLQQLIEVQTKCRC
jgi:hypothetical protein